MPSKSSSSSSSSPIHPPPPKRSRHMVDDLLSPDKPRLHQNYVRMINSNIDFTSKFQNGKITSTFVIENLPKNPVHLLRVLILQCIQKAVAQITVMSEGNKPDRIGVKISSPQLDKDICEPMRPLHEDTVENVLNRFLLVIQSRTAKGKGSVLGAPFHITVDTTCVEALPKHQQIQGSGRTFYSSRKHCNPIHHQVRPQALIWVENPPWKPYCLFYAMVLTRKYALLNWQEFGRYVNDKRQQWIDVFNLMKGAGIQMGQPTYDACIHGKLVIDYWNKIYANAGQQFRLFNFESSGHAGLPNFQYGSEQFNVPITIYHDVDHFHGIKRVGSMYKKEHKYCFSCLTTYRRDSDHTTACKAKCINCARVGVGMPCQAQAGFKPITCQKCERIFVNADCYAAHKGAECGRNKRCKDCGVIWSIKHNTRDERGGHVCGEARCHKCKKWHSTKVGCYIEPFLIKRRDPYRLVTYDFECTQHEQLLEEDAPERQLHQVNFISATVSCTNCMRNGKWRKPLRATGDHCHICGPDRKVCFSVRPFTKTRVDRQMQSNEPLRDFINWMLYELKAEHPTMAYSHFGGKYDMVIAFEEIYSHGLVPQMIRRGNKMYKMHVPKVAKSDNDQQQHQNGQRRSALLSGEINFHDSYNLLNVPLGKLPDAYGLDCADKPFFPHLANHPKNYGKTIPLPDMRDFLFGSMRTDQQAVFVPWYEAEKARGATFNLDEALAEYCCNDVQILTEALIAFREEFMELSRPKNGDSLPIDILQDAITIASACMKHFRMNHLVPNRLAIVPHGCYDQCDTQSRIALQLLAFLAHHHGTNIQTAMSKEGEKRIGKYKLDGYIAERDLGIEVHGCHYHVCDCKYKNPNEEVYIRNKPMTVSQIRELDREREDYLNSQLGGGLQIFWECQIKKMKQNDRKMDHFMKRCNVPRRLNIRDCFFGGRTGPHRMHYKCPSGYKMAYFDFCSLYPYITATTAYPIGHPKINIIEGDDQFVQWTRPDDVPVKGILSVHIVPPEHCAVPVVPVKFRDDDRLLFPLCRVCAMDYPKGAVIPWYSCPHRDPQMRGWESTITSIELREALAVGYRVDQYFRSYEWEEWDDTVFRGYVAEMMEMKIHASGFPNGVETEAQKDEFIRECMQRFGMKIDRTKMKVNKARRAIAKLMANNLWGRFALRCNLTKTWITNDPAEYRQYHEDKKIEVCRADKLTPETIMITYDVPDEFVEENEASNVMISAWTTAAARIKLLKEMQKVVNSGAILLYTDTDSVIFAYKEADGCPLKTGWHLGDLTDEYPEYDLIEFVSSGCKAYGIQMQHKVTKQLKIVMRLRGITLTGDVQKRLHFDSFKRCVLKFGERAMRMEEEGIDEQEIVLLDDLSKLEAEQPNEEDWTIEVEYPNFLQPNIAQGRVTSRKLVKRYRPIVSKGIVSNGLVIKDFGAR